MKLKRFLLLSTMIVLIVSPFNSLIIEKSFAENNEEVWIEVSTRDELQNIAENLDANYLLVEDIDLKDSDWKPLDQGEFTGMIIGDEYKIKNMPLEYVDHEYVGLFEKAEDRNAIQINVQFENLENEDEETIEADQELTHVEEKDEPTAKSSPNESIEQSNEKDEESSASPQEKGESVKVDNFNQFKSALEDSNITEINLTNNISARSSSSNRVSIKPRVITINGNGFEIKQNNAGILSYSMMKVDAGNVNNKAKITFKDVNMFSESNNSLLTDTGQSTDWQVIFERVNEGVFSPSNGSLVNAANAHVVFKGNVNFIGNGNPIIHAAKSITVDAGSEVNILSEKGKVYETDAASAELLVREGGILNLEGLRSDSSLIEFSGHDSKMNIEGGTLNIDSDRVYKDIKGGGGANQIRSGLIRFTGDRAEFNVNNGGNVEVKHRQGSILFMNSGDGRIDIKGQNTKVAFIVNGLGEDSNHDATIHLDSQSGYELVIDRGANLEVIKHAGTAMGIRLGEGKDHKVTVEGGSQLKIHHKGNGQSLDPSGEHGRNQALYFRGTSPVFYLSGEGSKAELVADYGAALHMTNGGKIEANEDTTLIAHGRTDSINRGVIDTGGDNDAGSQITLTNPAFYDFRNNNTEGYVFLTGATSSLVGNDTDIALWEKGKNVNLNGNHTFRFLDVSRYEYMNQNLMFMSDSTTSKGLKKVQKEYINGLQEFARISGNNGQAVVDDLYISTNADQKVYAHASVYEGVFDKRDAYTDEVEVDIIHTRKDGTEQLLQGRSVGQDQFPYNDKYEIYEKPVDPEVGAFGWVEVNFPKETYLEAGETIEVVGARVLGSDDNVMESNPENLFSEKRIVVDVTPPMPTELVDDVLTDHSRFIRGTLTEDDAHAIIKINGEKASGNTEYDRKSGTFKFTFSEQLTVGDEVQVFLSDNTGVAEGLGPEAGRPNKPKTNNDFGNMNPTESFTYHDQTFYAAPLIAVKKETGSLMFGSVPETLNFYVKLKPYKEEYLVDLDSLESDLIIRDTRVSKSSWELSVKMSQQLTAIDDKLLKLTNALIYRDGQSEVIINDENSIIASYAYNNNEEEKEEWNLSSDSDNGWGQGNNGLFISIEPGVLKKHYVGEVTWTLSDVP